MTPQTKETQLTDDAVYLMPEAASYQPLSSLATIRMGFTFREKVEEAPNGNVKVLQIKDLRRQHEELSSSALVVQPLPSINWLGPEKALLSVDSILVPARGEYNRASYISSDIDLIAEPIVASSQFLIVKPKKTKVLSAYLCWAINQTAAQHYLAQESRGTNMPMLNTKSLGQLKVPLPSLSMQERIVRLQQLWEKEQQLTKDLAKNRKTMLNGMFQQLLKEDHK